MYRLKKDLHCDRSGVLLQKKGDIIEGSVEDGMFEPDSTEWSISEDVMDEYLEPIAEDSP